MSRATRENDGLTKAEEREPIADRVRYYFGIARGDRREAAELLRREGIDEAKKTKGARESAKRLSQKLDRLRGLAAAADAVESGEWKPEPETEGEGR